MNRLLFLVHRIPYPPNKGDKIRSFNLVKYLARDYDIHLGAFVDDPSDWRHTGELRELCADMYLCSLHPRWAKLRSLRGLPSGRALTLPYYFDRAMARWVNSKLAEGIERVVVYSSPMAQYILGRTEPKLRRIVDFVDVDSEKWRHYGESHHWPMNWVYRRESRLLLAFERAVAAGVDASVFVTAEEAALFRSLAPETAERVGHMDNGVDTDYFDPNLESSNPYPAGTKVLVFTGAMDYWANIDAVTWFASEVFNAVRGAVPDAHFYIVGARPTDAVQKLAKHKGVHVTGAVKDIRPYLRHAVTAVASLRVARGLQNKVLEAMAMARPVIATPAAMEGIVERERFGLLVSDDPAMLAERAIALLTAQRGAELGTLGRELVLRRYEWNVHLGGFAALLDPSTQNGRLPDTADDVRATPMLSRAVAE